MTSFMRVLLVVGLAYVPLAAGEKPAPKKEAPWVEVRVTDPGSLLAADFAVKERSEKTKAAVKLGALVRAERQDVGTMGGNFRLCLKVTDDKAESFALVNVSVDNYSNHKLLGWDASDCGAPPKATKKGD